MFAYFARSHNFSFDLDGFSTFTFIHIIHYMYEKFDKFSNAMPHWPCYTLFKLTATRTSDDIFITFYWQ